MNRGKLLSGILAVGIYFLLLFIVLYNYNIHDQKAKNYVEKNSNRVTVTLINSDKTVFNRSDKINNPKRTPIETPLPRIKNNKNVIPPKTKVKKAITPSKKKREAHLNKEKERQKIAANKKAKAAALKKKKIAERKRQERLTKEREKKRLAQIALDKKKKEQAAKEAKAREKEAAKKKRAEAKKRQERLAKEREKKRQERLARAKKEQEGGRDLFASVNTKSPSTHQRQSQPSSRIKHNSSVADHIRNTHQSGTVSNRNREKGVEDAYKAKVQRRLNNWNAQSSYKGHSATIKLTISSSGHFRYTITRSSSPEMSRGLEVFLDQLNRMGLGRHGRSRPYVFSVTFKAR